MFNLPPSSAVVRLARIDRRENLILCEPMLFPGGASAIETLLRRAALAGKVEVNGVIENHFADILDENGDLIETIALDANSYRSLKTRWMRCVVEKTKEDTNA